MYLLMYVIKTQYVPIRTFHTTASVSLDIQEMERIVQVYTICLHVSSFSNSMNIFFLMHRFHYNFHVIYCFRYRRMFQCICESMSLKGKMQQYERFIQLHVSHWIFRRWKKLHRWGILYGLIYLLNL